MAVPLSLTLALGACVQPASVAQPAAASGPLRVTDGGQPFAMHDGAAARRVAEAECAARGQTLRPGIYDRYDAGAWVYVGGCA